MADPAETFEVGDQVRLKAERSWMTVEEIFPDGKVGCTWKPKGKSQRDKYPAAALTKKPMPMGFTVA